MTIEELKSNAAAMLAFADGQKIEYKCPSPNNPTWKEVSAVPNWNFDHIVYRPKPVPKTRRWSKPSDLPIGICYIRDKGDTEGFSTVLSANNYGFSRAVSLHIDNTTSQINRASWEDCSEFEYSTDRKTWLPCEVSE